MKKVVLTAICLLAVIDVAAGQALVVNEELRQLRAENNMLKAQVKALKRQLAKLSSTAATKPATRSTTRPESGTKPAVKPTVRPTVKPGRGSTPFTVILYNNNPRWWTDLDEFAKEVATRQVVGQLEPKHAVNAWLERNKWFVGRKVKWRLNVTRREVLSKALAGERYYRAINQKESVEKRIATYRRGKAGRTDAARQAIAIAERQIRQYQAEADQYKALMDGDGGALVTASIQKPAIINVTAAIPGGEKITPGKETDVSGKIAYAVSGGGGYSSAAGRPVTSGAILVALIGK